MRIARVEFQGSLITVPVTNAEYLRNKRLLAIEQGKCGTCRARDAKPGCRTCQQCIDKSQRVKRRLKNQRRCECGQKAKRGIVRCAGCAHATAIRAARRKR